MHELPPADVFFGVARDSDGSATYYLGTAAESTTECLSLETNANVSQSAVGGSPLNGDLEQALVGALEGVVQSEEGRWNQRAWEREGEWNQGWTWNQGSERRWQLSWRRQWWQANDEWRRQWWQENWGR